MIDANSRSSYVSNVGEHGKDALRLQVDAQLPNDQAAPRLEQAAIRREALQQVGEEQTEVVLVRPAADLREQTQIAQNDLLAGIGQHTEQDGYTAILDGEQLRGALGMQHHEPLEGL